MIAVLLAILSLSFLLVLCKKEQKSDDEAAEEHPAPVQSTYRRYTSPRQSVASRSGRRREQPAPSEAATHYENAEKEETDCEQQGGSKEIAGAKNNA